MSTRTLTKPLYWALLAAVTATGLAIVAMPGAHAASAAASAGQLAPLADASGTGSPSTDTQPPTTPTGLTVSYRCDSTQGTLMTLSWTASTDDVGVTGYDIYATQGVSSGTFAFVATTTTTSYTQRVALGSFEVRARDAAGNTSEFTAPRLITPPPSPCVTHSPSASPSVSPTPQHGTCAASYSLGASWTGGFQGQVTVTNTGTDTTTSWTVSLTFTGGQTITQVWGASMRLRTQNLGSPFVFDNLAYNGALSPGASTAFGFIGNSSGTNSAPAVTCTRTP